MKPWLKRILIGVCIILIAALIGAGWYLSNTLPIGTGHVAKTLCSNVFISKRNPEIVFQEDIAPVHFLFAITKFDVNETEKSVTSTSFGFFGTKAIYREGCGCTVVNGISEAGLRRQTFMNIAALSSDGKEINLEIVSKAVAAGFVPLEVPAVLTGRRAGKSNSS